MYIIKIYIIKYFKKLFGYVSIFFFYWHIWHFSYNLHAAFFFLSYICLNMKNIINYLFIIRLIINLLLIIILNITCNRITPLKFVKRGKNINLNLIIW